MGRQNPVLLEFLEIYKKTHSIVYAFRKVENDSFNYYDSNGKFVGDANTRENYIRLMHGAKCLFYATSNMDDDKGLNTKFNQVTPRFLEIIASGAHVIARYKKNSDTDFYEIEKFSPSIESYKDFEIAMDRALSTKVDMIMYSKYLQKHYTSVRVNELNEIIKDL